MVEGIDIDIKALLWLSSCSSPPMRYGLCSRKAVTSYKNVYRMGCHTWPWLQLSPGWHCQGSEIHSPSDRMTRDLKPETPLCAVASRVLHSMARLPWGLHAPLGRSTSRAFSVPGIQGPAGAKREVGAIRLCCLGGFQGD